MPAPLTYLGQRLFGKTFQGLGKKTANAIISPGLWAEELGRVLGLTTRDQTQRLVRKAVKGRAGQQAVGTPMVGVGPMQVPNPNYKPPVKPIKARKAVYADVDWEDQPLTRSGKVLQSLGMVGGVGTLGYNMFKGDGTEPAKDGNGVKNPAYNEELAKIRTKFQGESLGGDNLFTPSKYKALRSRATWVDTAIEQIGKDNYMQLKQQLADGTLEGGAARMHSILTDALADIGDEETMKNAGTQPYVLPGLASKGDKKRVIVITPMVGKDKQLKIHALQYGIHEDVEPQQ